MQTNYTVVTIRPVITPAAYGAADQIGQPLPLTGALPNQKSAILESIVILDTAAQSTGYVVTFFNQLPSVTSADNAIIEITDANAATQMIGNVIVSATDIVNYGTGPTCSMISARNVGLVLRKAANAEIYALLRPTSTPTYGAADNLTIHFGFRHV